MHGPSSSAGHRRAILNEINRNLADTMSVARNVVFNPTLVPGGGAVEMVILVGLYARARAVTGVETRTFPRSPVVDALEVIPRILVQNAGWNAIRALTSTALRVRLFSSFSVPSPFSSLNVSLILYLFISLGKTYKWGTIVGYRWRDG